MHYKNKSLLTNPDPVLTRLNFFAVALAVNQILYAPTLALFIGHEGLKAWPVVLTVPFFAATLWLTRRWPFVARVWVPLIGIMDCVLAQLVLGFDSGVWLFLFPSITLAICVLRKNERIYLATLTLLAMAVYFFLPHGGSTFSAATNASVAATNGVSALLLTGFIGWIFAAEKSRG